MIPRISLVLIAITLCLPRILQADTPKRPARVRHHMIIDSVSADSITIELTNDDSGTSKTYKITKATEISFKGQETTADQLQQGMRVSVTPDPADDTVASVIQAEDPPKDSSPKPTK